MPRELSVKAIVIQGLAILLLCAIIEIFAGNVLEGMKGHLTITLPGLILAIPPLLGLRGSINGALASRLGTALNTGVIEPKLSMSAELKINMISSMILSFLASATIGLLSVGVGTLFGITSINVLGIVTIVTIAGVVSGIILAAITVVVSIFSYVKGWDPDNVTAPLMATIGDLLTMVSIFLVAILVV